MVAKHTGSATLPQEIRAYGDRQGDGMVQMSFVLPIAPSARAKEGARQFAEAHGLDYTPLADVLPLSAV